MKIPDRIVSNQGKISLDTVFGWLFVILLTLTSKLKPKADSQVLMF